MAALLSSGGGGSSGFGLPFLGNLGGLFGGGKIPGGFSNYLDYFKSLGLVNRPSTPMSEQTPLGGSSTQIPPGRGGPPNQLPNSGGGIPGIGSMPTWMQLLLAGGGALTGFLNNSTGARTSTSENNSANSTLTSTSTNRDLTPDQQAIQDPLFGYALQSMLEPNQLIAPIRQSAVNSVNRNYSKAPQAIADKLLSYGGSRSGKFGRGQRLLEQSRMGDLSDLEGTISGLVLNQQNQGASLAERLLGMNMGQSTTGATTSTGQSNGTNVGAGSAAGGALGGGLETLMTLLYLDKLGKGSI